jgi:type II secretory pathway pseudopilin PulG
VRLARIHRRTSKNQEQGYVLLLMLFFAALLVIAMTAAAPNFATQIKRDRETEMIHRGEQYARAVKRYYRKFGRYPGRIEDLEKTNNIRFLRKRYKDPMTPDGNWRLVRFGEVQLGGAQALAGATPVANMASGAQPGSSFGGGGSSFGGGSTFGGSSSPGTGSSFGPSTSLGSSGSFGSNNSQNSAGSQGATPGGTAGSSSTTDVSNSGTTAQSSSLFGQQITGGAGAIIGVASQSKKSGIHEFNKKAAYKDWLFVYDATRDKGQLIKGPFNPNAFVGQFNNVLGSQGSQGIGQPIGGTQNGFGNSNGQSSFGNNNQSGFGNSNPPPGGYTPGMGGAQIPH